MKVEGCLKPNVISIEHASNDKVELSLRENIRTATRLINDGEEEREETYYEYDEYRMVIDIREDLSAYISEHLEELIAKARTDEFDKLASEARTKRDELLASTDSMFAIDHLGLEPPLKGGITDWINFFKEFGLALTNEFAKYRQALRDVPQQKGFPYDIVWPDIPSK